MKYAVIACDGMSERIIHGEGVQTSLSSASIHTADKLSCSGEYGIAKTTDTVTLPDTLKANIYLMGYDPKSTFTGGSAFRAVAGGINIMQGDVVFSCKFLSLSDEEKYEEKTILSEISDLGFDEKEQIFTLLSEKLDSKIFSFGLSKYGELFLIWHEGEPNPGLLYSADEGMKTADVMPRGDFAEPLCNLMRKSNELLTGSGVNTERTASGKPEIDSILISDAGTLSQAIQFKEKYGHNGVVISPDEAVEGFAKYIGMEAIHYEDIEKDRIAEKTVDCLCSGKDYVYIHIDSPSVYSMKKDSSGKIRCIEIIDKAVLSELIDGLSARNEEYRIMFISSFSCNVNEGFITSEPVPYVIYDSRSEESSTTVYNEQKAFEAGKYIEYGTDITEYLLSSFNENKNE